jgi:hypothetical protein
VRKHQLFERAMRQPGGFDYYSPEQIVVLIEEANIMFECLSRRSPNPEYRRYAEVQLLHPVWRKTWVERSNLS